MRYTNFLTLPALTAALMLLAGAPEARGQKVFGLELGGHHGSEHSGLGLAFKKGRLDFGFHGRHGRDDDHGRRGRRGRHGRHDDRGRRGRHGRHDDHGRRGRHGRRHRSTYHHVHTPHCHRHWVPGGFRKVADRVWVPAHTRRVWRRAVYDYVYDDCGNRRRVLVRPGRYEIIRDPGHWKTVYRTVRRPGRWVYDCGY